MKLFNSTPIKMNVGFWEWLMNQISKISWHESLERIYCNRKNSLRYTEEQEGRIRKTLKLAGSATLIVIVFPLLLFHSILFFYLAANVLPSAFWCMSASLSSLSQQKRFLCISYLFNYKLDLSLNVGISISIRLQLV